MTRRLLSLVQGYRAKSAATEKLSGSELLLHLVQLLSVAEDTPEDKTAMARTFGVWFRPGPDCSGAADLLREANVGDFDVEDLNELRRNPAFAHLKDLFEAFRCRENDHATAEQLYNCIHILAVEVGQSIC